jgi:hypothetical protein
MKTPHPQPKALTFKTRLFGTARVVTGTYGNGGRLAVDIVDENGESIATLSVNMAERADLLGEHEFFAKTWSENGEIAEEALASGHFLDTGRTSGDVVNASIWTLR